MNAYHYFINTKEVLELLFLKFFFSGPPRLGKTTEQRRLMGEIVDLVSAGEAYAVHPSTGAVETGSAMIVKSVSSCTAAATKTEWRAAKSHTDEARMLLLKLMQGMETKHVPPTTSMSAEDKVDTVTVGEATSTKPTATLHKPEVK